MSVNISGSKYAAMYGPTVGDKVRLADTSLVIEVEKDYTTYGDECKFGGGKTLRDGMGHTESLRLTTGTYCCNTLLNVHDIRIPHYHSHLL